MITTKVDEDLYRELTRPATTPSVSQAWPDQWVDWGGHTVTVDPMGNKQWINDSHDGHKRSEERGRYYDTKAVNGLIGKSGITSLEDPHYFTPSVEGVQRYNPVMEDQVLGCRSWRGVKRDSSRFGELPTITALLRENKLGSKDYGQIEKEMREERRRSGSRLFDCDELIPRRQFN